MASIVKPETILPWHRKLIAKKFDGSQQRRAPGLPSISAELEALARTANSIAALWSERGKAPVSVSGYLIGSREINKRPLPPKAELAWWYQFYFATERGQAGYEQYRREFAKLIW